MNLAYALNTAWMWRCGSAVRTFARMTHRVAATQAGLLRNILRRNRDTRFGRRHAFDRLDDPHAYQQRVPLSAYADYTEAVARIGNGEANVLTRERVLLLEPTSGSTGAEKLVPYTASLRREFQVAVNAWIGNLLRHRPAVRRGRAYWSISPAFGRRRRTAAGIPIGFDDDTAYLGTAERWLAQRLLAVPGSIARLSDIEAVRYATLRHLLAAEDLALISVWNPSFLTALLAPLQEWSDRLLRDLRSTIPRRADAVAGILRASPHISDAVPQFWPRLAVISCWTDAASARFVPELRQLFPGVEVQPKGLLATEGIVSFPLCDRPGAVLAVGSHFLEFQEAGGACRLAHELDVAGRYRVILTTGGGLYRYQLHDEIEVVGFEQQCPLVRFLGKADRTSDLVGEKLGEPFVRAAIERALDNVGARARFAMLVPVLERPPRYRLYVQVASRESTRPTDLAEILQAELEANPHYRYAVQLRQLGTVEVAWLDDREPAERVVERRLLAKGKVAGGIKPAALDAWTGWPELFQPMISSSIPASFQAAGSGATTVTGS
jgi:hypothetical protein